MLHVVFQQADVAVLQKAQELDESLNGEIFEIKDDYAVGPLYKLQDAEGWQARRDWWRMLLEASGDYKVDETMDMVDDKLTFHQLKKRLDENETEQVWIWAAQNKHDVSGYYWLISQLAPYQGRVYILYLNNLPFINEKGGIFYPLNLSEIQPKEFLKAKKLARPVTLSEFELDPDEWRKICSENKMVRLLEGGKKLGQASETYFDDALLKYITGDFQKCSRVLQQFLSKEKETTGDVFLTWRIKTLVAQRMESAEPLEVRGDLQKTTRDFDIRNPAVASTRKKVEVENEPE